MASAKDLRKRISSVKNTQQITKAMKMVSAAKLRRAQENIVSLRPYSREMSKVVGSLAQAVKASGEESHPLLEAKSEIKSCLVFVVTSDRGLCGALNANVIKTAARFIKNEAPKYEKCDLAFIGKKGYEYFKNRKPGKYYQDFYAGFRMPKATQLAEELIALYLSGQYDHIRFIYSEFKSAISQSVMDESFLPVGTLGESSTTESEMTLYEPTVRDILDGILPKHFATQICRIVYDALASEHAARMSAMENASKNAGEMIKKITLLYNKTRQAAITKELLEITSGAEAQKA